MQKQGVFMILKNLVAASLVLLFAASAQSQVSAGVSVTDDGLKSFYLAIGQTYHVPEREIVVVRDRHIPDEEIPVVYFIARRAHIRPETVVDLRLKGQSWMDITLHYGLSPEIFYVAYDGDPGPIYSRPYGFYRGHPRAEWRKIRLSDDDVCNMVNLRFVSNYYKVRPYEVVRIRGEQGNFVKVTRYVSSPEYKSRKVAMVKVKDQESHRGKGHGNGNGNGHGNKHRD
jgi:hypothetical protein